MRQRFGDSNTRSAQLMPSAIFGAVEAGQALLRMMKVMITVWLSLTSYASLISFLYPLRNTLAIRTHAALYTQANQSMLSGSLPHLNVASD